MEKITHLLWKEVDLQIFENLNDVNCCSKFNNLILVTCHQPSLKEALTAHPTGINDWWLNVVCELAFITCGMVSTGLHSLLMIFIDALSLEYHFRMGYKCLFNLSLLPYSPLRHIECRDLLKGLLYR